MVNGVLLGSKVLDVEDDAAADAQQELNDV